MSTSLVSLASLVQAFDPVTPQLRVAAIIVRQNQILLVEHRKRGHLPDVREDDAKFAEWLTEQGQTVEEFDTEVREASEKAVKTQLVLDAIADAESVNVSETELTERIVYQAQRFGISPDEYVQRAQQSGQLGAIFNDVRRGKALATVVRQATVTDATGNALDMDSLFGVAPTGGTDEVDEAPAVVEAQASGGPQ